MKVTSCGVLVRDGAGLVLLGQATGTARWDIPKGVAAAGEAFVDAAVRELGEETGLVLLGQATSVGRGASARWDIPKGVAEAGESFADAAARELREEAGLAVEAGSLRAMGVHRYLPAKDLALFGCEIAVIEVGALRCESMFTARDGRVLPEMAGFALVPWAEALGRVGKNMRRVLEGVGP